MYQRVRIYTNVVGAKKTKNHGIEKHTYDVEGLRKSLNCRRRSTARLPIHIRKKKYLHRGICVFPHTYSQRNIKTYSKRQEIECGRAINRDGIWRKRGFEGKIARLDYETLTASKVCIPNSLSLSLPLPPLSYSLTLLLTLSLRHCQYDMTRLPSSFLIICSSLVRNVLVTQSISIFHVL
jgi:hypothetical protein